MKERRSRERIPDQIPVLLTRELGDPDIRSAEVRNLSEGGACACVEEAPAVGSEVYVGFFLERFGGLPLIARMRVQWTRREGGEQLVGLAFLADGPAQRDAVERMRDYLALRRKELLAASA